MTPQERQALLAKGRLLFDSCSAENDYSHNHGLGGARAEVAAEFVSWLKAQHEAGSAHAAGILEQLEMSEDQDEHEASLPNRQQP
ncbi:hypothetical protein DCC62_04280 [candidate division KSB1 bacterium]|nr:MAG: hypothetical protein DCC62_04280 [candidate division KSB1 bacterium]